MVGFVDLEDELKWSGSRRNKKDDEFYMVNVNVGDIDPTEIFKFVERATYASRKATLTTLKLRYLR